MMRLPLLFFLVLCVQATRLAGATFNIANGDVAALANAITTCNSNHQNDTINLATNGSYILTTSYSSADFGPSGLPAIGYDQQHSVTINGNNSTITRSSVAGTPDFRVLLVNNNDENNTFPTTINNVTFTNGSGNAGAGLYIQGCAVLNNCTITGNHSSGIGGGLASTLYVALRNCTIMNNSARQFGGAAYAFNVYDPSTFLQPAPGRLSFTQCTFFNNGTEINSPTGIYNRQVSNLSSVTVDLIRCTVVGTNFYNEASTQGTGAIITFSGSLLAGSSFTNVNGSIVSNGYNLSRESNLYFTQSTDLNAADPQLDPSGPQANGGSTLTIALCAGSAAIDHGSSGQFDLLDQRGFPRRVDNPLVANTNDGTDIGAYEASSDPLQYGIPSFVITSNTDHDDGVCSQNDCTLREAIVRNNYLEDAPYDLVFAAGVSGTITLAGELSLVHGVNITGPGARVLAISANNQSRVFSFFGSIFGTLTGLTIRDGYVSGAAGSSNVGGGIYNEGILRLIDCALLHNRVVGGNGVANSGQDGGLARGGGIFNGGSLTLSGCTIGGADSSTANSATGGTGADHPSDGEILYTGGKGGAALGGAIYNDTNATLTMSNCTIAGNTAAGGAGGAAYTGGAGGEGTGGIYNAKIMTVTDSTISANSGNGGIGGRGQFTSNNGAAGRGIGGVHSNTGTATIRSSIIAANTHTQAGGIDVEGAFVTGGFNLIGTASNATGFTNATDLAGTNTAIIAPLLGPIQNNGGATNTMALLAGSPALDHGNSFGLTSDQRGRAHSDDPILGNPGNGDGTDTGAYESSCARIIGINRGGAATTITFIGTVGRQFQLQRRFSFTSAWTADPNSQNTVFSAGQTMQLMDLHANDSRTIYYRIQEL